MTTLADLKQALHDEIPYLRERYHVDLGMPSALKDGPAADNIRREVQYFDETWTHLSA